MLVENAQYVKAGSQGVNMQKLTVAQDRVVTGFVRVVSVRLRGAQDVYNMEVAGTRCFSINGGLIVHNCLDATRYSLEKLIFRKTTIHVG